MEGQPEVWSAAFDTLEKIVMALVGFGTAYIAYRQRKLDSEVKQTKEVSAETKEIVAQNNQAIAQIKTDSAVLKKKLLAATAASSYAEGVQQGRSAAIEERQVQDDLDRAREEFRPRDE